MATSKKKQMEKEREESFQKVKAGMEKPKEEKVPVFKADDLVVVEIQNKYKPFMKFSLLHSWRTKKGSYIGSSAVCLAAAAFYVYKGIWDNAALFLGLAIVFPLLLAALHCLSARAQLKNDKEFNETKHVYHFRENEFEGVSTYQNHVGSFCEKYDELLEAIDKDDYVYIYVNKGTAFVIEKANFVKGDRAELERLLGKIRGYAK